MGEETEAAEEKGDGRKGGIEKRERKEKRYREVGERMEETEKEMNEGKESRGRKKGASKKKRKTGKIVKERIEQKGENYTRQRENKLPITYFQLWYPLNPMSMWPEEVVLEARTCFPSIGLIFVYQIMNISLG